MNFKCDSRCQSPPDIEVGNPFCIGMPSGDNDMANFCMMQSKEFLNNTPTSILFPTKRGNFQSIFRAKEKKDPFQTYSFRIFSSRLLFFWMAKQKKLRFYFDIWQPFLFQNFWYKFIPLLSLFSSTFPFQFQLFLSLFMLHVYKKNCHNKFSS